VLECYNDYGTDFPGGDPVTVDTSGVTTGIDLVLGESARYARVSGTVTGPAGEPLADIWVSPHAGRPIPDQPHPYYPYLPSPTTTDEAGRYAFTTLLPRTYTFHFDDPQNRHLDQFYSGAATAADATLIAVGEGEVRDDIDATLSLGGQIAGRVYITDTILAQGGQVTVYGQGEPGSGWQQMQSTEIDRNTGAYRISGLTTGAYRLEASGQLSPNFYRRFYGGAETVEDAADVPVTVDEVTAGIDIALTDTFAPFEGEISGVVTANGEPQAGMRIDVYPYPNVSGSLVYTHTDASGRYTMGGLGDGQYYVGFSDPQGALATVYYNQQAWLTQAAAIPIQGRTVYTQVNAALTPGGSLRGIVRTADDGALPAGELQVYAHDGTNWQPAVDPDQIAIDAGGAYSVSGLMPALYHVCYQEWPTAVPVENPWVWTCFAGAAPQHAADIPVTAGATTSGIDMVLGVSVPPIAGRQLYLPMAQQ